MLRGQRSHSALCLGEAAGNRERCERNRGQRICQNSGESGGIARRKEGERSGRASECDLAITLDAPAPPSGTWVKLMERAEGTFNSLPPYYRVSPQQTQETIRNLEVRKPAATTTLTVIASTVGRAQTDELSITP